MTEQQKANLLTLASYLLSGNLKARFDMEHFTSALGSDTGHNCGTIGCAVGHGPYAGIPKISAESWLGYTERVFGIYSYSDKFSFLFGSHWRRVDNTPQGAAKRILFFLRKGEKEAITTYLGLTSRELITEYSKEEL